MDDVECLYDNFQYYRQICALLPMKLNDSQFDNYCKNT